jgi:citrate synthase
VKEDLIAAVYDRVVQGEKSNFSPIRILAMAALHLSALEIAEDTAGRSDVRMSGVQLISAFAGASGYFGSGTYQPAAGEEFVAQRILRGFGLSHWPDQDKLLVTMHAALVLSADNELSAPTFCARIASSAGVDVHASVASALMAQAGPMQAGGMMDLGQYLSDMLAADDKPVAYTGVPCFGHPLYDRDPRAELLLSMIRDLPGDAAIKERLQRFVSAVYQNTGASPNLFGALVILLRVLGLPASAAVYLHCVGRAAGWIAHAAEQRLSGVMLRPRARYMGIHPVHST